MMKSAYELAMSRLEKNQPSSSLSEEQKRALAEIDSEIEAKIAEQRLFLDAEIVKVVQKLANPNFTAKVPPAVLAEHEQRLVEWKAKLAHTQSALETLG